MKSGVASESPHSLNSPDNHDQQSRTRKKRGRKDQPAITPAPRINARDFGALTDYINAALQAGPQGFRRAQREATRFARRFGVTYLEPQWFACTPWLKEWASGALGTRANGIPLTNGAEQRGERDSRVRVRVAVAWRGRWLCNYAMSGSKVMACQNARVGHSTVDYHLKNDPDFAAQAEAAKAHAIDLLFTRCMQRCLEGDVEPIYWQGILVDHVRKFDSRLQIEMLRAHMPNTFKTPGSGGINVDTGDKILVMTEELRAKLIAAHREEILALPVDAPTGAPDSESV
jgi:hypothetical protein